MAMKKLLLAGVAALLMATSATHAQTIPKQFRGNWCGWGHVTYSQLSLERALCDDRDLTPRYKIGAKGYIAGFKCTAIKVRREPEGRWSIKFRCPKFCPNSRCSSKVVSDQIWWIDQGSLIIREAGDICPENPFSEYESDCDFRTDK